MDENREIGTDTKGKMIAGSGIQKEREEEAAGMENEADICLEGHASSSSPRNQSANEIDTVESSKAAGESANPLLPHHTQVGENVGILMFEMTLTQSSVKRNELLIPREIAFDSFHPLCEHRSNFWVKLSLTEQENLRYSVSLRFDPVENSFEIVGGWWQRFVHKYNAEAMDVLRFYKPVQTSLETDVLIEFFKTRNREIVDFSISNATQVGENMGIFLFEMSLTQRDFELGRLSIPVQFALPYFPRLPNRKNDYGRIVQITDPGSVSLNLFMKFDSSERTFVNEGDLWKELVETFKLEAKDLIRFYRPVQRAHPYHFLIDFIRFMPEFKPKNFLFELELTGYGIEFRRLVIPMEDVRNHFPYVNQDEMRMRFTDAQNKSWLIKIILIIQTYMLVLEEDFVIDNNMKHGDVIKFYKPIRPLHRLHYLVEFVEKPAASTSDPTQSTTNPTQSRNRGNKKQGGSGGGGGGKHSGGRKGRKFGGCHVT